MSFINRLLCSHHYTHSYIDVYDGINHHYIEKYRKCTKCGLIEKNISTDKDIEYLCNLDISHTESYDANVKLNKIKPEWVKLDKLDDIHNIDIHGIEQYIDLKAYIREKKLHKILDD